MSRTKPSPAPVDRGDGTRQKLLLAAIDVFGRLGYDGATTRALAEAAGVNLQAIPYYFGGKEGLYRAVALHIAAGVALRMQPVRLRLQSRFAAETHGEAISPEEARILLTDLLQELVELLMRPEWETWARVVIREQMEPTEAFQILFTTGMQPQIRAARHLVGRCLDLDPAAEVVGIRALGLIGGVLMFRTARAAVLRVMDWDAVGVREIALIRDLVETLVAGLQPEEKPT